jgi:hypothetical protein
MFTSTRTFLFHRSPTLSKRKNKIELVFHIGTSYDSYFPVHQRRTSIHLFIFSHLIYLNRKRYHPNLLQDTFYQHISLYTIFLLLFIEHPLKGLCHQKDFKYLTKLLTNLGLNKGRGWFGFFRDSSSFISK